VEVDERVDVEFLPRDLDPGRQIVEVDKCDARLRACVAGDEPDEAGDEQRVEDENGDKERRPPQEQEVLAKQQQRPLHAKASARPSRS
jgi:hypothetical protein